MRMPRPVARRLAGFSLAASLCALALVGLNALAAPADEPSDSDVTIVVPPAGPAPSDTGAPPPDTGPAPSDTGTPSDAPPAPGEDPPGGGPVLGPPSQVPATGTASPKKSTTPKSTKSAKTTTKPTPKPKATPKRTRGSGSGSGGGGTDGGGEVPPSSSDTPVADDGVPPCIPSEPPLPTAPAAVADAEVTVDKEIHLPGDEATASAPGFGPAEQVQLALLSTPTLIGTFTADSTGQVTAGFSIAQTLTPGTHVAQFTGWCGRIATGDVVVGSPGIPASVDPEGSRSWPWWLLVVLAVCVGIGVWRLIVWRRRRREEEEDDYDDDDDDIDDGGLGLNADGAVDGGSGRPAPWPGPTKDAP